MTPPKLTRRIILSRRTLWGWRAMLPTGKPENTLRMIGEEIELLTGFAIAQPKKAGAVGTLIQQWRELAGEVRAKAN